MSEANISDAVGSGGDGPNLYNYVNSNPINYIDAWGENGVAINIQQPFALQQIPIEVLTRSIAIKAEKEKPVNPNNTQKGNDCPDKSAAAKEEAINPTLHLSEKGEKEDVSKEGEEGNKVKEEIKWRQKLGRDGSKSRIRKVKDGQGNTIEVWHEVFDKKGNIIHRDWKGPGNNPYRK